MDVSVIIVNYNTKDLTVNCIKSVIDHTFDIMYEIIVSDNGSRDGSVEMIKKEFPNVVVIENNDNLGFGRANNVGLKSAKGKYVFYLNSDTTLENNAIKYFYDFWENNNDLSIGALGCQLIDEKRNFIHSGANFPTYKSITEENIKIFNRHKKYSIIKKFHFFWILELYSKLKKETNMVMEEEQFIAVDYVTGADLFMLNNNDALYDEDFFLYYEETDMQKRLSNKGKKSYIIKGPSIIHYVNKNSKNRKITSFSVIHSQLSALLYVKKHLQCATKELESIIMSDWNLHYVNQEINKIGKDLLYKQFNKIKSIGENL